MGGHNPFSAWLKKSGVFSKNRGLLFLPGPVTAGLGSQLLFGASSALFPRQLWHPPVRPTTICSPSTSVNISQNMSGWWLSLPLWKIYKSVGIIIPNIYIYGKIIQMFQTTNESTTGRDFCLRIKLNQHPMDGTRLYSNPLLYHPALGSELLREAQLAGRTASLFTPDRLRHGAARPICTLQCASSSYQISGRQKH